MLYVHISRSDHCSLSLTHRVNDNTDVLFIRVYGIVHYNSTINFFTRHRSWIIDFSWKGIVQDILLYWNCWLAIGFFIFRCLINTIKHDFRFGTAEREMYFVTWLELIFISEALLMYGSNFINKYDYCIMQYRLNKTKYRLEIFFLNKKNT